MPPEEDPDGCSPTAVPLLAMRDVSVFHRHEDGSTADIRATPAGVTFSVRPGEAVLLLGPSGCGKSTLALATNGLIPHIVGADLTGTVEVAGRNTRDHRVPELARHVAMVFQDPDAQVVTATVLDEVCFGPENLCLPAAEVLERAEDALRRVGLWERRADDPDRLSGGGRQRLAIACALAMRAPLLVLDEPTANLDPAGVEEVYAVLRDIAATGAHGVLLVEHSLDTAIDVVDRVVVLDAAGRVVLDGPARATLSTYSSMLLDLGVWLPVSALAALRLRAAGVALDPLPLTPAELGAALDAQVALPEPAPRAEPEPDGVAVLVVDGLTVERGGEPVLHDVSLRVGTGEFVAVVGANGAGKTTLAQAIAGVVRPPRGTVTVAGLDPARADARELAGRIGFVFQNPEHQFVTGRVDDELALGLRIRGVPEDEVTARVEEVLTRFGLGELRDLHPFLLSGGQKRRLSVGTAIICRPGVLVLDEPTFGQDRERAAELLDLLTGLHASGTTVVVVSHDMQLVAEHATRVIALDRGRVVADGPPAEVFAADLPGLRPPPVARATRGLANHPAWRSVTRLADLPRAVVVAR
ncbi:energy-coupling factor transporter ATPase [Dactylosporangium fulvum]|uniref:Energy-coupling factor transporter ATPase n=1 Tax=Dactylosporangium fulvum TaxID=53359 RepID=A0ABY5VYD2_9ACTN|nr:ABC transporter ATP-binding protein [Dactylosporangium fulvum]UWP81871.1 energy-coupling factor transporter ATPase [Dactylosporangium fulvum]